MKEKKHKYYEDLIEEYLLLSEERAEIPKLIEKSKSKFDALITDKAGSALKSGEANDGYKVFLQIKKQEDRKAEVEEEYKEVENTLKEYLQFMVGNKVPYQERDEEDKTKVNYLFWLEEGEIKSNRLV